MKKGRHERPCTVWFHSYEMTSRMLGQGEWGVAAYEYVVFYGEVMKVR